MKASASISRTRRMIAFDCAAETIEYTTLRSQCAYEPSPSKMVAPCSVSS